MLTYQSRKVRWSAKKVRLKSAGMKITVHLLIGTMLFHATGYGMALIRDFAPGLLQRALADGKPVHDTVARRGMHRKLSRSWPAFVR